MAGRSVIVGVLHVTGYVLLSFVWVAVIAQVTFELLPDEALNMGSAEAFVEALGPGFLALTMALQGAGLAALAFTSAALLPHGDAEPPLLGGGPLLARWRDTFAARRVAVEWVVAAVFGALTVGWLPGWLFEQLVSLAPDGYAPMHALISEQLMTGGTAAGRAALMAAIVLGAPIFEEVVFRGYLWSALQRSGPPVFAWVGTSLLFAAYHQDPAQMIALLPTAFFIGWLRLASGSLWPSLVAHFVNNALVAIALAATYPERGAPMPLWLALLGCGITVSICAAAWSWGRRGPWTPARSGGPP